jgi:hyperpolarization activated cyclic nucleotide-gated potassium channel 2
MFLIDIGVNFNTAFYKMGIYVTARCEIAKNYLKFWFWLDFIASFPYDWVFLIFVESWPEI